jgi:hypothetical protein
MAGSRRLSAAAGVVILVGLALLPSRVATAGSRGAMVVTGDEANAAAINRALILLPRRPEYVAVIDPEAVKPEVRETLFKVDAFISRGQPVVYLSPHSEVLKGAREGSRIHTYMLAVIIWHEMAHLGGADEREAQRKEEGLWKRFVVEKRVDAVTALRYLKLMDDRHRDRELAVVVEKR